MKAPAMYAISPFFGFIAIEEAEEFAPSIVFELPDDPHWDIPMILSTCKDGTGSFVEL